MKVLLRLGVVSLKLYRTEAEDAIYPEKVTLYAWPDFLLYHLLHLLPRGSRILRSSELWARCPAGLGVVMR